MTTMKIWRNVLVMCAALLIWLNENVQRCTPESHFSSLAVDFFIPFP